VEAYGSAYFRVPSGVPVFFQALDRDGLAVQTMRTLTYVQPGQTLSCVGCHESRDAAPAPAATPLAARRAPAKLTADPSGSWPLRFDELVQPVLDKQCVSCHKQGATDPKGAKFDLSAPKAYQSLLTYAGGDLKKLAFEKDRSVVGDCPARKSKLMGLLSAEKGHEGVRLDAAARYRLAVWMDTYAQVQGSFSKQQEDELRQFRQKMAGMLEE
jgi:cytochrome c553